MRVTTSICLIVCLFGLLNPLVAENFTEKKIAISEDIELIQIKEDFYIHTTWYNFPGFGKFPSNGVIFVKNGKALLVDTPVNIAQTKAIADYLKDSLNSVITHVVVGHYHDDCLGGLGYLHDQGSASISGELTKQKCIEKKLPIPQTTFNTQLSFQFEGNEIECHYLGGGHTADNIVVFFPEDKILFGGCLLKSTDSKSLGNTKEAVIEEWDVTLKKLMAACSNSDIVIPGHGSHGDSDLLSHTIDLVENYRQELAD